MTSPAQTGGATAKHIDDNSPSRVQIAWTGIILSVLASFTTAISGPPVLRLVAVLGFCCIGPGAALVSHVNIASRPTAWALANGLSLSLWGLASATMAWFHMWSPETMLIILSTAAAGGCALALKRSPSRGTEQ